MADGRRGMPQTAAQRRATMRNRALWQLDGMKGNLRQIEGHVTAEMLEELADVLQRARRQVELNMGVLDATNQED